MRLIIWRSPTRAMYISIPGVRHMHRGLGTFAYAAAAIPGKCASSASTMRPAKLYVALGTLSHPKLVLPVRAPTRP